MKKVMTIVVLAVFMLAMTSCSEIGTVEIDESVNVPETLSAEAVTDAETEVQETDETEDAKATASEAVSDYSSVDVDLTTLSSTMVYAEVYNMMCNPDDYLGETVRMTGTFAVYEGELRNYYACIITDATACCSQGIEFVLSGDYSYPDDYPELGTEITVSGVFETYYEGLYLYLQLSDAVME